MNPLHPRLQVPFALLLTSAGLQSLFVLGSLFWLGINLISMLVRVVDMANSPELLAITAGMTVWQAVTKLPQLILVPGAFLTGRAAWHVYEGGRVDVIRFGAVAAAIAPLIALIGSFCLWLSFDCIGFIFGGAGRFLMLVIGLVTLGTTLDALQDPTVIEGLDTSERDFSA